jgi:cytochrome c oxidase subunit IV
MCKLQGQRKDPSVASAATDTHHKAKTGNVQLKMWDIMCTLTTLSDLQTYMMIYVLIQQTVLVLSKQIYVLIQQTALVLSKQIYVLIQQTSMVLSKQIYVLIQQTAPVLSKQI